jgi:arylsulfatase
VSNTPFRLHKLTIHEGGIATPFIARWPAQLRAGMLHRDLGYLPDLMATCVAISRATFPATFGGRPTVPPEGVNLVPALQGKLLAERALCWEHEGNRGVRQGRWKLVARHEGPWELYDMEADRSELHDLSGREPQRVADLSRRHAAWAKHAGVLPWPLPKK